MTNVLIVDDEMLTVEIIQSEMNWAALGIDQVFTAYSMRQACEIFEQQSIDIMICDIEMPHGSGLSLLEWVRENHYETITIFLTGHASFEYATQAIALGSLDYVLKPIPFDHLTSVIQRAVDEVAKRRQRQEFVNYGENWLDSRTKLLEQFWLEVLSETIASDLDSISQTAKRRNIPFDSNNRHILILIAMKSGSPRPKNLNRWDLEFALKNVASELLGSEGEQPVTLNQHSMALILSIQPDHPLTLPDLEKRCQQFCQEIRKYLQVEINCYIGDPSPAHDLACQLKQLKELEQNNVTADRKVMILQRDQIRPVEYHRPDMQIWACLLLERRSRELTRVAKEYLNQLTGSGQIDARTLRQFQQDFMQMVYAVLNEQDIPANLVFLSDEAAELYITATASVAAMIKMIDYVIEKAIFYATADQQPETVTDRIRKFITSNIYKDISREDIVSVVNLNPEYLSRLFKKETGLSLTEYIQNEKIALAKQLLRETGLSVSEIASRLSYSNFAYFSQIFKRISGQSPQAWRKKS